MALVPERSRGRVRRLTGQANDRQNGMVDAIGERIARERTARRLSIEQLASQPLAGDLLMATVEVPSGATRKVSL